MMTTTKRNSHYLVNRWRLRKQSLLCMLLTAVACGLLYLSFEVWALPPDKPVQVVDVRMEVACKWPTREGAMTVVTVLKGKLVCWRWE